MRNIVLIDAFYFSPFAFTPRSVQILAQTLINIASGFTNDKKKFFREHIA